MLRPFFTYYGGKWAAALRYPSPDHDHIVEPFAGSAGYSLRHANKNVTLIERDPFVAATWSYLLRVSAKEILSLPDVRPGESVDDLPICHEARVLIGWWLNPGSAQPKKTPTARSIRAVHRIIGWGAPTRDRIARQLESVRHWKLIEGSYDSAPNGPATWFIDPPYQVKGRYYRFGCSQIDYGHLGDWCKARTGQTIVCENEGADWLPFKAFLHIRANTSNGVARVSREATWQS